MLIVMADEYSVELDVGVDPSVVYRISAPLVVVDIVTLCEEVKLPPFGETVGVTAVSVKAALAIFDGDDPESHARALRVALWVIETVLPDVTVGSLSVGSLPFVV